jgi:ribosomal-protein-alanine N-acetyltransferase
MTIVVNDQIHLDEIRATDKPACVEHFREKEIYDHTLRIPYPYTEQDFDQFLTKLQQGPLTTWAIRTRDGFLIGGLGFDEFVIGTSHRAEIGYWLAKPYWGRGIMTEVVRAACAFAFEQFGLVKITAGVFADNSASARVLEKCGFQQEGYLRKHYLKAGQFIDARLFALLKEEQPKT